MVSMKKIEFIDETTDVSEIEKKRIRNNRLFLLIISLVLLVFFITI